MVARFTREAKTLYPGRYKRPALRFDRAEPEDTKALRRLARASHTGDTVGFYRNMGAVQDGETRSLVDGRPVPHFVYDV